MLTSDAVDPFGADREAARELRLLISRQAFERGGVFLLYIPCGEFPRADAAADEGAEADAAKREQLIMYMMQAHMLDHMFVAEPQWAERSGLRRSAGSCDFDNDPAGGTNRRFA